MKEWEEATGSGTVESACLPGGNRDEINLHISDIV